MQTIHPRGATSSTDTSAGTGTVAPVAVVELEGSARLPTLPGDFSVHYQPVLDLRDGSLHTCDAVSRWWHPVFGVLRPEPSLKGTSWVDEVRAIETWAIHEACRQASAWLDLQPDIEVTANASPSRLMAPDLLPTVDAALAAADLEPWHLAVAVPLGAVAVDPLPLARTMAGLDERGVSVVLDGVGAGAALSSVGRNSAKVWRIDVRPARGRAPLHPTSVEALERAHQLGAVALACSVDDAATLTQAIDVGFDLVMGRVISPPITALAAQAMFRRGPQRRRSSMFTGSGSSSRR